ncbi:MAG TPA: diacylglycerol kinase family protein [Roseiflexaceae bacterium]|jgi:YegS/Rv2252/BmrU family lipid kinase|nr:diacylglycerol kinase family protein [Roseiflexaceae bacterium]
MERAVAPEQERAFIILNPVAGNSTPDEVRAVLERTLGAKGWRYDIYETTGHDDMRAEVDRALAEGCDLVVAAGGDGTVSIVANTLADTGVPLGILPIGTANVLALELGIPRVLEEAAALFAGELVFRELDMMRVRNRNFILQIGIGLDSMMIKDTARSAKRIFGRLAYMATLVGKLFGYQSQRYTIMVDGQRLRPRAWQVLVANAGTLGIPPFKWGPDISPADHELDLCIFSVRRAIDYVRLLRQFVTGKPVKGSNVMYRRIQKHVMISTDRPLPVQADGEIIGETPIEIDVVPRGIKIVVPASTSPAPVVSVAEEVHHD